MGEQKIYIEKDYILADNKNILGNYWYKYVIRIIQLILEEYEDVILEELDEDSFETFYELVDKTAENINGMNFQKNELPVDISKIETAIVNSINNCGELCIEIYNSKYYIKKENFNAWTDSYFQNLIIPYLQLGAGKILIESSHDYLRILFNRQIQKAGYETFSESEFEKKILEIDLIKEDNEIVKWNSNNSMLILNDLFGYIPIKLEITFNTRENQELAVDIAFPFFKKGDQVNIFIQKDELKWNFLAINNNIKYVREIEL